MDSVAINTTQNVIIDYEPAGLGNRILAGLLDSLFKAAYVITWVVVLISSKAFDVRSQTAIIFIITLITLPLFLYDLLFEIFMQGQSLGKKIMKIKVVKLDGTQPSVASYFLRWLIGLLENNAAIFYCGIAVVTIAASKNRQRLGDMAGGTTVVKIKAEVTLKDTILHAEQSEAYKIVFPDVAKLSEKDVELMKEVHEFYKKVGNNETLTKLTAKIKEKTGIRTTMRDHEFIATLLKDYSNYKFAD